MPRLPRYFVSGAYYHVIQHGVERRQIFMSDAGREKYLELLAEGVGRFDHRVCAYCLMGNHYHLLIRMGKVRLDRVMQHLNFRYAQWFNRAQKRVGPLFQNRYKAIIVDEAAYLQQLSAYIHFNPVRAGMVNDPAKYRWSSCGAYVKGDGPQWLSTADVLRMFSARVGTARKKYRAFLSAGDWDSDERKGFQRGAEREPRVYGNDEFIANIAAKAGQDVTSVGTLAEMIEATCQIWQLDKKALMKPGRHRYPAMARAMLAYAIRESSAHRLTALAQQSGRGSASVSESANKWQQMLETNKEARKRYQQFQRLFP